MSLKKCTIHLQVENDINDGNRTKNAVPLHICDMHNVASLVMSMNSVTNNVEKQSPTD